MPALVAGIHVLTARRESTWMAGTSPAMTADGYCQKSHRRHCERKRSNPGATKKVWIASQFTLLATTPEPHAPLMQRPRHRLVQRRVDGVEPRGDLVADGAHDECAGEA